ncbi:MAG TPA: hypoxanthine phosphoribosyltransferase [Elusimicrobia bacterium]|nr:hypoxanthine phosphoribosyltransferase [Elusimicrobiota bacterium]HBT60989.1 hypoxanthine phosphoribosyltransferase [Elusimicrobiota bacterium]
MVESSLHVHPDVEKILIDQAELRKRVRELGRQISRDYAGRALTLVGILRGSVVFMGDLLKEITADCRVDFISVSSYSGRRSRGEVRLLLDLRDSAAGQDLLIVEDIMDSGLTLHYLLDSLKARGPKSLEVCTLLDKPDCRKVDVQAKYVGFRIPNEFVVGYGLDYNERYRNLPYVGVLKSGK